MSDGSEWSNQPVVTFLVVVESGAPGTGVFIYSGTPSAANPPIATLTNAATDPFGTAVLPGFVSYAAAGIVGQLNNALLSLGPGGNATERAWLAFANAQNAMVLDSPGSATGVYGSVSLFPPGSGGSGSSGQVVVATVTGTGVPATPVSAAELEVQGVLGLVSQATPSGLVGAAGLYGNTNGTAAMVTPAGFAGTLPATQTDESTVTNTANTSFAALSNVWSVPANDGQTGTAYRLTVAGSGTWGATAEQLSFQVGGMGAGGMGAVTIGSSVFPINTPFAWKVVCEVVLASPTVARCTINGVLSVNNGNAIVNSNAATNSTVPFTSWQSPITVVTNVNTNLTLQSKFQGAFGSIASGYSLFERLGP